MGPSQQLAPAFRDPLALGDLGLSPGEWGLQLCNQNLFQISRDASSPREKTLKVLTSWGSRASHPNQGGGGGGGTNRSLFKGPIPGPSLRPTRSGSGGWSPGHCLLARAPRESCLLDLKGQQRWGNLSTGSPLYCPRPATTLPGDSRESARTDEQGPAFPPFSPAAHAAHTFPAVSKFKMGPF